MAGHGESPIHGGQPVEPESHFCLLMGYLKRFLCAIPVYVTTTKFLNTRNARSAALISLALSIVTLQVFGVRFDWIGLEDVRH